MSERPPDEPSIAAADLGGRNALTKGARGAQTFAVTSAPAAAPPASDNLIDRTIAVWQPRLGRQISREEARQFAENVTGFFSILHEWSRGDAPAAANDNNQAGVRGEASQ